MERTIISQLDSWLRSSGRKPLILKGARQTGKTWAIKEFGRRQFTEKGLKSFYQIHPQQAIIYAGSHLSLLQSGMSYPEGSKNRDFSFPVGNVKFMQLQPMTFHEFTWAAHPYPDCYPVAHPAISTCNREPVQALLF